MAANKSNRRNSSRRILRSTGSLAARSMEGTAKFMTKDQSSSNLFLATGWGICLLTARIKLASRRAERANAQIRRLIDTGVEVDMLERVDGWIIDHLLFLWDVLWGTIKLILVLLLSGIIATLTTLLFYYILIAGTFWLLTCDQVPSQAAMP